MAANCSSLLVGYVDMFNRLLGVISATVSGRPENHRWCIVPVSEEARRCDDPHSLLLKCVRPHRITTVHGPFKTKVCTDANTR